jgi:carbon-monoxide dehydrogenase large subunit
MTPPRTDDGRDREWAVRGTGRYTADLSLPGDAVALFVRADAAHAEIVRIDLDEARAMPGVLGVFHRQDLLSVAPGMPDQLDTLQNADGSPAPAPRRPILADTVIRFAGEAVALIVAETLAQALAAADAVVLEHKELPVVIDPQLSEDCVLDWAAGDRAKTDAAFAAAAHVVEVACRIPRLCAVPMEPAGARAEWHARDDSYTLTLPSQGAHTIRNEIADHCLRIDRGRLRVVTPDVGGAFGARIHIIPEQPALLAAARLVGRPVVWAATRIETMLAEPHARDFAVKARLALDADARFLAVDIDATVGVGAYVHPWSRPNSTVGFFQGVLGPYRLDTAAARVRCVQTNTTPIGPFRGAGEPEGCHVMETLVAEAATQLGLDPVELRRRNLLLREDFPVTLPSGFTVDSGDPDAVLTRLTALVRPAPPPPFAGEMTGQALALYMKKNGVGRTERAEFRLSSDGRLRIGIGSQCNGQGHATTFANLAARRLGIASDRIDIVQGDTHAIAHGTGTGGSSALGTTGTGVADGCDALIEEARSRAARLMGLPVAGVIYDAGVVRAITTNDSLSLAEIAAAEPMEVLGISDLVQTFTFGAHHATVAVDPDTGIVRVLRYVAIDDLGPVMEPALAEAQIVGGVAQGIAQAMAEAMVHDPSTGQPLTASFMDYAMQRASDICMIETEMVETPSLTTPLGVRGAGEAGAVPSMTVVVAAVNQALGLSGTSRIEPPLTPAKVWQAIEGRRT